MRLLFQMYELGCWLSKRLPRPSRTNQSLSKDHNLNYAATSWTKKSSEMSIGGAIKARGVVSSDPAEANSQKRGVVVIKVCVDDFPVSQR